MSQAVKGCERPSRGEKIACDVRFTLDATPFDRVGLAPRPPEQSVMGAGACEAVDRSRWYCLRTDPRKERIAETAIAAVGFVTFLPLVEVRWRPFGRPTVATRLDPAFPGYVFVQCDLAVPGWQRLRRGDVDGVAEWVRMPGAERPSPARGGIIEALIALRVLRLPANDVPEELAEGAPVEALAGPFAGYRGLVRMSAAERVRVMMTIFGRETPVEFDRRDVRRL